MKPITASSADAPAAMRVFDGPDAFEWSERAAQRICELASLVQAHAKKTGLSVEQSVVALGLEAEFDFGDETTPTA